MRRHPQQFLAQLDTGCTLPCGAKAAEDHDKAIHLTRSNPAALLVVPARWNQQCLLPHQGPLASSSSAVWLLVGTASLQLHLGCLSFLL